MPFYTGKSEDGSDMEEVDGLYINPNNPEQWSNKPYPEQAKQIRIYNEILIHLTKNNISLDSLYKQIINKTANISRRCKIYVLDLYDVNGQFIQQNNE